MRLLEVTAALLVGAAAVACSGGSVDPNAGNGGGGGVAGSGGSGGTSDGTWSLQLIESGDTGIQPSLALSPSGKLGLAYFRKLTTQTTCTPSIGQPSTVIQFNVVYAGEDTNFTPENAATPSLVQNNGLSLAFDAAGNPAIGYEGGGTTSTYCGGSDMMVARRAGTKWTESTVAADGNGYPIYFMSEAMDCMGGAPGQNYCTSGDVVGLWPAVLFTGATPFYAFQDYHYGFAQDDKEKADVDVEWSTKADVDGAHGAGWYIQARKDAAGNPAIAYYNPWADIVPSGIYVVSWNGSKFVKTRVVKLNAQDLIGAQIGFAETTGKMAVAWNVDRQLFYSESTDGGATFSTPEVADNHGDTGHLPSMDFDAMGRPVIAYYYCGKYDPNATSCNPSQDALKFAVKDNGVWTTHQVDGRSAHNIFNLSMVIDGSGQPAIAYQSGTVDVETGMGIRQVVLAREVSE